MPNGPPSPRSGLDPLAILSEISKSVKPRLASFRSFRGGRGVSEASRGEGGGAQPARRPGGGTLGSLPAAGWTPSSRCDSDLLRSVHGLAPQEPWVGRKVDLVCLSYEDFRAWKPRLHDPKLSSLSTLQTVVTEDFSHLPPEQQRKRLQQQLEERNRELQKEIDQR